jgi:hypothetical protein
MEEVLAPTYYRHHHPELGTGYARVQGGAGPFIILTTGKYLYSCPTWETERISRQEYEQKVFVDEQSDVD